MDIHPISGVPHGRPMSAIEADASVRSASPISSASADAAILAIQSAEFILMRRRYPSEDALNHLRSALSILEGRS